MTNRLESASHSGPSDAPDTSLQTLERSPVALQSNQASGGNRQGTDQGDAGGGRDKHAGGRDKTSDTAPHEEDPRPYDGQDHCEPSVDMEKMDAQRQLNEYRERLAREMERRERSARGGQLPASELTRVSPIQEESVMSPQPPSEPTTASTESGNTVRGGMTPGLAARTPSYPFPRMASALAQSSQHNRPFPTLSPTMEGLKSQDSILSNPSTPASTITFLPQGYSNSREAHDFPSPNLYDLSLMLSAEPGLDAWWNTVVQIMTEVYRAERVTLAVPADSTDIENVPWGQKATFSVHQEDDLSLGYMARGSSLIPSSNEDVSVSESLSHSDILLKPRTPQRPPLVNRHSFTSYEERKEKSTPERMQSGLRRPAPPIRSKSSFPAPSHSEGSGVNDSSGIHLNQKALEEHDALEERQDIPSWEVPYSNPGTTQGKVLNVLQALDYEADPLIDHNGVTRVLERGRVIALTRNYPYLDPTMPENQSPESKSKATEPIRRAKKLRPDASKQLSTLLNNATAASGRSAKGPGGESKPISSRIDDIDPRPPTPKYEEFEQAPPSPWSQSPAPSPVVRPDPSENPSLPMPWLTRTPSTLRHHPRTTQA